MKADGKTETAVMDLVQEFIAAYAERDLKRVMAIYAADAYVAIYIDGKRYVGQDKIRAMVESDLRSFDAITWHLQRPSISTAGSVAWFTTDATASGQTGGQPVSLGAYRFTWVCERCEEQWLIVHAHISTLAGDAQTG
jgi:uncharacterized protein (TIGR02246 family)